VLALGGDHVLGPGHERHQLVLAIPPNLSCLAEKFADGLADMSGDSSEKQLDEPKVVMRRSPLNP